MVTVFISIPWFIPAFRAGGPVQSIANLVAEFQDGIQYKIFCGNSDLNGIILEGITSDTWINYNDCTEVWYASPGKRNRTLLNLVKQVKPDALFIIGVFSWNYNIAPLLFCNVARKILSVRGMLHPGALSQKPVKKRLYLLFFRLALSRKKFFFHATDDIEKAIIKATIGEMHPVFVAGNIPRTITTVDKTAKVKGNLKLISIALISPMKNHLLVLQALMNCHSRIEYHICGPVKDMEYWNLCLAQKDKLPANIQVIYHGDIFPTQVPGYLNNADVFILPSKSENFGHSLYEGLSASLPVITSNFTPWKNLEALKAGINIDNNPVSLLQAIEYFAVMDQQTFADWQKAAFVYSQTAIDLKKIKKQYAVMFTL